MNAHPAWLTHGSYLKNGGGAFGAECVISPPLEIIEAASALQAELHRHISLCLAAVFYKLKVCDNPGTNKSQETRGLIGTTATILHHSSQQCRIPGATFPTASAHVVCLSHFGNSRSNACCDDQ